ncbi:MAG: DNA-3-methyladenine glycosylase [Bacteroidota bacterium]|nr:DNA-3-methyladenine glycosylase [Bacteroidota bacterium]
MLNSLKRLPRSFYLRPTITVAKDLLGKYLIRKYKGKLLVGKIVETEAYLQNDNASHSFRGKTKRNEVMFCEGGHLYVYFTYGMHFCCNVVTEEEGKGCAVLIRAVEPVENIELMKTHRKIDTSKNIYNLTNGPAKLCQAFGLGRNENGTDLCGEQIWFGEINISKIPNLPAHSRSEGVGQAGLKSKISSSSRIGITNGSEHQWRFYIKENRWVSRK